MLTVLRAVPFFLFTIARAIGMTLDASITLAETSSRFIIVLYLRMCIQSCSTTTQAMQVRLLVCLSDSDRYTTWSTLMPCSSAMLTHECDRLGSRISIVRQRSERFAGQATSAAWSVDALLFAYELCVRCLQVHYGRCDFAAGSLWRTAVAEALTSCLNDKAILLAAEEKYD